MRLLAQGGQGPGRVVDGPDCCWPHKCQAIRHLDMEEGRRQGWDSCGQHLQGEVVSGQCPGVEHSPGSHRRPGTAAVHGGLILSTCSVSGLPTQCPQWTCPVPPLASVHTPQGVALCFHTVPTQLPPQSSGFGWPCNPAASKPLPWVWPRPSALWPPGPTWPSPAGSPGAPSPSAPSAHPWSGSGGHPHRPRTGQRRR